MKWVCHAIVAGCISALTVVSSATSSETPAVGLPRPEHPMPQMQRAEWLNLNGTWEFAETNDAKDTSWLSDKAYPDKIVVPFCRESKLSGLARTGFVTNVWYRRTFQKPADWKSSRVRLHVGACDWKTTVWVNGQPAGQHTGGSAAFCFDVTDLLKPGDNTVVIHAFDDTAANSKPPASKPTAKRAKVASIRAPPAFGKRSGSKASDRHSSATCGSSPTSSSLASSSKPRSMGRAMG